MACVIHYQKCLRTIFLVNKLGDIVVGLNLRQFIYITPQRNLLDFIVVSVSEDSFKPLYL